MPEDNRKIKPATLETLRNTIIEIFADGEFHQAGIRDICKQAKVSPQTVYKYFGNKEMLLLSCMEQDLQQLFEYVQNAVAKNDNPITQLQTFAVASAEFYATKPAVARIIFLNIPSIYWVKRQSHSLSKYQDLLLTIIESAKNQKLLNNDMDTQLLFDILSGSFNRTMLRWVNDDYSSDIVKQSRAMAGIIEQLTH